MKYVLKILDLGLKLTETLAHKLVKMFVTSRGLRTGVEAALAHFVFDSPCFTTLPSTVSVASISCLEMVIFGVAPQENEVTLSLCKNILPLI